jgi:peptidoglycan/xylan/chitin deacetylase (PgdA/CDA1 family)
MADLTLAYPPLTRYKAALVMSMLVAVVIVIGGAFFIGSEPTISLRGLRAIIERKMLITQYASLRAAAPASGSARTIPILTYHRVVSDADDVNNVTRSRFEDQMVTLKKAGWQTVSLPEFESFMRGERTLPEKSFLLTFDDGAKDSYYPVDPVLEALGYEAANFIIVEPSRMQNSVYYLNEKEIRRMLDSGRWTIGSHSFDGHRPYPTDAHGTTGIFFADRLWDFTNNRLETPDEFAARVDADLVSSKKALENDYGVPIRSFAFPLGNETGVAGSNNYPEGSGITERIARGIYDFGFLQTDDQEFTAAIPRGTAAATVDPFRVYRIHVDYDWDGARVLSILENGFPKQLPYEDDFTENNGWIPAWGSYEIGRNNFVLRGDESGSGASTFLDGTSLWDNFSFDASINWHRGTMFILADVVDSGTYRSCAFSPGRVRLLLTVHGQVTELADIRDPRIAYGDNVRMGARVHGDVFECTWNFQSIAENYHRDFRGGIGLQMWDDATDTSIQVSSIIVRPYVTNQ